MLGIPRKVTYRDLQSWLDDGRRYELHDGEVVVVPAPFPRHQIAVRTLQHDRYELALSAGRGDPVRSSVLAGFSCPAETIFPW